MSKVIKLTPREEEVLSLMCQGKENKEIALGLGICDGTVKQHISSILWKLGVDNRTEAVLKTLGNRGHWCPISKDLLCREGFCLGCELLLFLVRLLTFPSGVVEDKKELEPIRQVVTEPYYLN